MVGGWSTCCIGRGWHNGFCSSLEVFKIRLDKALSNLVWSPSWCCFEQEDGLETSGGPFQPRLFHDSVILKFTVCICQNPVLLLRPKMLSKCLLPGGNKSIALHCWCQYLCRNYHHIFILIFMQMTNMSKCSQMSLWNHCSSPHVLSTFSPFLCWQEEDSHELRSGLLSPGGIIQRSSSKNGPNCARLTSVWCRRKSLWTQAQCCPYVATYRCWL